MFYYKADNRCIRLRQDQVDSSIGVEIYSCSNIHVFIEMVPVMDNMVFIFLTDSNIRVYIEIVDDTDLGCHVTKTAFHISLCNIKKH